MRSLHAALYAAKQASQLAEYQDGLAAYREAKDAAEDRVRAVTEEIDRRLPTLSERRAAEHG